MASLTDVGPSDDDPKFGYTDSELAEIYQAAYDSGLDDDFGDPGHETDWEGLVRYLETGTHGLPEKSWDHPILKKIKSEYRRGKRDGKAF